MRMYVVSQEQYSDYGAIVLINHSCPRPYQFRKHVEVAMRQLVHENLSSFCPKPISNERLAEELCKRYDYHRIQFGGEVNLQRELGNKVTAYFEEQERVK